MNRARILLMRHGQIIQSAPRRFVGQSDIDLDETGRAQALAAGARLADAGIERVVCSDLKRTRQTAALIMGDKGLDLEPDPRLREINLGQWEGLTKDEVRQAFPGEFEARGADMAGFRPRGGESFRDLQNRVVPCFEEIAASARGPVLVVAHAGVNRAILCHLLGLDLKNLFRFGQDYCCLNTISIDESRVVESINIPIGQAVA